MSQTSPPSITAAPATPDRADRATFSARATALADWIKLHLVGEVAAVATNVYNNALDAYNSAVAAAASVVAAAASASNASASATAAANAATAAAWVNGGTYALNAIAISQLDWQPYRKITASSVTTTDPASDPTNWAPQGWLRTATVTGTTATASAGTRQVITNVAATAITAPSPVEGAEFEVIVGNGLYTNTVDFGAKSIVGPAGTIAGVVTLNLRAPLRARFNSTLDKWVATI